MMCSNMKYILLEYQKTLPQKLNCPAIVVSLGKNAQSDTPLPTSIRFEKINAYHGRTHFTYQPSRNTISGWVGKVQEVMVQNEYILPTNTITRVFAGDTVKTVFTRTIPLEKNKTLLYWKIYRNFWIHPFFDGIIARLMRQTVKEDVKILNTLHQERPTTIRTKYDITIENFRKALQEFQMVACV